MKKSILIFLIVLVALFASTSFEQHPNDQKSVGDKEEISVELENTAKHSLQEILKESDCNT